MSAPIDKSKALPIPQPPEHLFGLLGNLPDVDPSFFLKSVWNFEKLYGEIFQLNLVTRTQIFLSTYELINEVFDDEKFEKTISGPLVELRPAIKDGLFTAYGSEPNWGKAHRLLMNVFGPLSVRKMFPDMKQIAHQMVERWDRMGPNYEIVASDDFTRLAFDTIGLCGFSYHFFEFYSEHVHPFATQMAETLTQAGKIANRTSIENYLRASEKRHMEENIAAMHKLCDDIIADRKKRPQPDRHDLLNTMLETADPVTGEKLSDENIRYQLVTFLIAGHETTSGTLSFLVYHFLNNPDKMLKAQQEVDEVLGDEDIDLKHIPKLKYVDACIKEALRFQGPIGLNNRTPKQDVMLGGRYFIPKGQSIVSSLHGLHHDPKVWGEDENVYRPERMLDMSKIPPGAWKPFGTGERSCIGRAFAEQEMIAAVAMILQRYQLDWADPNYKLELKSTLTVKPLDFKFKVTKRPGKGGIANAPPAQGTPDARIPTAAAQSSSDSLITVYYGSNAGTCKSFAEEVQAAAPSFGYTVQLKTLDEATQNMSKDSPCVIITASYEGKPPDNAKKFVSWLEHNKDSKDGLKGVRYSLFGVGNPEWATTYQRVPKLVDELMLAQGAVRLNDSVYSDIKENAMGEFEDWLAAFKEALGTKNASRAVLKTLKTTVIKSGTPGLLGQSDMSFGIVRESRELADTSVGPLKKHTAIELPQGSTYRSGDYLVVLPLNNISTVERVLQRFELHADDLIQVNDTNKAHLLSETPKTAYEFFATRVELNNIITQRQLDLIIEGTTDASEKAQLEKLRSDAAYKTEIVAKRASVLDILEDHKSTTLTLNDYLDMLKPLSPRQYSISSSPLASLTAKDAGTHGPIATVTYDVHSAPALSGAHRHFYGVASNFLSSRALGSRIHCYVRPTNAAFHLPSDPKTPVIMIAAGSGLAPMRGFIQERAALAEARGPAALGPALFYFGCRDFERDYIYRDELAAWEAAGHVQMRPAFSKRGPPGAAAAYQYVPDRLWAEREEVRTLFRDAGAKVFLCGSAGKLAKSTNEVMLRIARETHPEWSDEKALAWLDSIKETRFVSDVFD